MVQALKLQTHFVTKIQQSIMNAIPKQTHNGHNNNNGKIIKHQPQKPKAKPPEPHPEQKEFEIDRK